MVMLSTTLASGLENMIPTDQETVVLNRFSSAWETYFYGASVAGIPVNPNSLAAATTALKAAMVGISVQNAGAIKIQTGIVAFWGIIATAAPTVWTTVPPCTGAIPPTTLTTIAASLTSVFAANTSSKLELSAACAAIATAIHSKNLGGICTIPIPGAPTPIL
jgi:hypothetical protein